MQTARLVQAVILMLIVAMAASCVSSKEYTSKLFGPKQEMLADSQSVAIKFLDIDEAETDKNNWVTTDIVNGKDTSNQTWALDNLSRTIPATPQTGKIDSVKKAIPAVESEPVAKSTTNPDGTRSKRTRD